MTEKETLLDLFQDFAWRLRRVIEGTPPAALRWQPDAEANDIAVTVWHVSRSFDLFKVRFLERRGPEEELWHTHGWAAKTGYDPQGIGPLGLGNLHGYTRTEVEAVPFLPADDLLAYFDQALEAMCAYVGDMPPDALHQPAAGPPGTQLTGYEWIKNLLADGHQHLGEIKAIRAMWERKKRFTDNNYRIRPARPEDVPILPEIERAADDLFAGLALVQGSEHHGRPIEVLEEAQKAGRLWVAGMARAPGGQPVGFAMATVVDGLAHLEEVDVHPDHGRRGLGTALVEAVCEWAENTGLGAVTLSTFRDIPWNAPFYRRLGFRTLAEDELTDGLLRLREREAEQGLPIGERVIMQREI